MNTMNIMNIMNLFKHNQKEIITEYIKVSGNFLNEHPKLHKYPDFKFKNESTYKCGKNQEGIIIEFEEF